MDDNFPDKIFFSYEAHFIFGGYVNKQNSRIWGFENPQVIEEDFLITSRKNYYLVRSLIRSCDWLKYHPICFQKVIENYLKKINACNTSR